MVSTTFKISTYLSMLINAASLDSLEIGALSAVSQHESFEQKIQRFKFRGILKSEKSQTPYSTSHSYRYSLCNNSRCTVNAGSFGDVAVVLMFWAFYGEI
jgi:hypothetical protein